MALPSIKTCVIGYCFVNINLNQRTYSSVRLGVLKDLCSDIILGQDFQKQHKSVIFEFGGTKPELKLPKFTPSCAFSAASIEEPSFSQILSLAFLLQVNQGVSARKIRSL